MFRNRCTVTLFAKDVFNTNYQKSRYSVSKHEYYWESNEWNFMLKDMLVVLFFMSYPIFFLLKYWLCLCRKRKGGGSNTGMVVLTAPVWCLLTMCHPPLMG